jgi:acetyl esterase/lipase
MRSTAVTAILTVLVWIGLGGAARADEAPKFQRTSDVIYGRKYGLALTMDVFTPEKPNGAAVIFVISGGWFSRPEAINPAYVHEFLRRGYTVFAVVHGSQPKFTVPEILDDMHRSVRFIRHNAKRFNIDPDRIGITGASAGGHLSLMMATTGGPGNPKAADPVDRESSQVQAAAVFFPPTDFLNFGKPGNELIDRALKPPFTAAVDFHEFNKEKALFVPITDEKKLREIMTRISPAQQITATTAPILFIHGDKDELVPLQQSQWMLDKLRTAKVPAELIVKKDGGHGWGTILEDTKPMADWFDKYLAKKAGT